MKNWKSKDDATKLLTALTAMAFVASLAIGYSVRTVRIVNAENIVDNEPALWYDVYITR